MEFRLLEYFLAVCEELHFTKAAVKLGISQPTLSQQIRLLEERVGTPLFRRIGKKNVLTEAGQTLREHSFRIFHELRQMQLEIDELKGMQRGKLKIGCSGNHLLTQAMITFHQKVPGVSLSVLELTTDETRAGLLDNKLDLGVVFLPLEDEQLVSRELYTEELCAAVSYEHEWAGMETVKLAQLQDIPLILFPDKYFVRQLIDIYSRQAGAVLRPIIELSTMDSMLQLVRLHTGATILPKSYLEQIPDHDIRIIPITDPVPHKKVGIVYRKETFINRAMDAFIHELTRSFDTQHSTLI